MQPSPVGGGGGGGGDSSSSATPMDIDPIDGGPRPTATSHSKPLALLTGGALHDAPYQQPTALALMGATGASTEEEARQAIEMLRSDDLSARVLAAHRLDSVANVLGEERTREELLPFVSESVDDDDEVLLALASSLGRMVDQVGGPSHADSLLMPLEMLLTVEEAGVRDAAAASARAVSGSLSDEQFGMYADMLSRLATKEWFTARISSAGLIAAAYPRLATEEQKMDQLSHFERLCKDDTPMVRRVAAQYLGAMVVNVVRAMGRSSLEQNGIVTRTFIPLYETFAANDQPDSVRLQTSENCVAFGQVMKELADKDPPLRECEVALLQKILPLIVSTIDDRSWRVRWTAAAKFALVIQAYDQLPDAIDTLVPAYEKLLQDPEAEVRTAATFNLAQVAKCRATVPAPPPQGRAALSSHSADAHKRVSVAERLVQKVTELTGDDSEHVRAALAMVATELAPLLGREATISYLVPPVLLLLRDAASEVRLNLMSSLSALNEVMGIDLLSQSLLPAILDLAQDGKWRIRLAIIQHIPLLAKQLGRDFFTEKLAALCVGWLGDDIASIRAASAVTLKHLTALFGTDWALENLIPSILVIRRHASYLRRLTALQACSMMATEMSPEIATLDILPLVLEMATDSVANIRFNVAKELQSMAPVCGLTSYELQVLPVLNMLMNDDDRDVRFCAEKAVAALDEVFAEMEE